jgi:lipopolysaccharide export system permease protein
MMKKLDRYLLQELAGPFFLAVMGLAIFLVLNLIIALSGLMAGHGVGVLAMARLILRRLPDLMVVAFPMALLFAIFLGLGRLVHDREVMGMEAGGISRRRFLAPLFLAGLIVAIGNFFFHNWVAPHAEHAYQMEIRRIIFRGRLPHIRAHTFFTGPGETFFYGRSFDERDGTLSGILIHDMGGDLVPRKGDATMMVVTAETGRWIDDTWILFDGVIFGYDRQGRLVYTARFASIEIATGLASADFVLGAKSPSEMRLEELLARIEILRRAGLDITRLRVELHSRFAIPLTALIFALIGGPLCLIFSKRSRAMGVVISLLLVGFFQGTLLWAETMGRGGVISPAIAGWGPNLLFGLIGLYLYLRLDSLSHPIRWRGFQHKLLLGLFIVTLSSSFLAVAGEPVIEITADRLTVAAEKEAIHAQGAVTVKYGNTILHADEVRLNRIDGARWKFQAQGAVDLQIGEDFKLQSDQLFAFLRAKDEELITTAAEAEQLRGQTIFTNAQGEEHILNFTGHHALIRFDNAGEVEAIELTRGTATTCDKCMVPIRDQPFAIDMGRMIIYPDRLIVAFDITVRAFGLPIFWLPAYIRPLDEILESPLFPATGTHPLRGWFLKWNLPFFIDQFNHGTILIDFYSRFTEIGAGAIFHYQFFGQRGRIRFYHFPARVGDARTEISIDNIWTIVPEFELAKRADFTQIGAQRHLTFAVLTATTFHDWRIDLRSERTEKEEDGVIKIIERIPEITIARTAFTLLPITITPGASIGRFRELRGIEEIGSGLRADGSLSFHLPSVLLWSSPGQDISFTSTAGVRISYYYADDLIFSREVVDLSANLTYRQSGIRSEITHRYRRVVGRSPFEFDRIDKRHHITANLRIGMESPLQLTIAGGYNLGIGQIDPLSFNINYRFGAGSVTLKGVYNIPFARLDRLTLTGDWRREKVHLSFTVPYNVARGIFDTSLLRFATGNESGEISLSLKYDLNTMHLISTTLSTELIWEAQWGVALGFTYHVDGSLTGVTARLFREFYDCMRIGVEYRAGQFLFYVSILAFPEAVLRYAPPIR